MLTSLAPPLRHFGSHPPAALPLPDPDRADIWLSRLTSGQPPHHEADTVVLDAEEAARAAGFRRPADRLLYTAAHARLRTLLGRYLNMRPNEVRFVREKCPQCGGPHGRPALASPAPVHFSLSHSSEMIMIGVAASAIGVDIEIDHTGPVEMMLPLLHPDERRELNAMGSGSMADAFTQLWTRKEAYLKGIGTGLSRGPDLDYLGRDPAAQPAGWTVIDIPCPPGYRSAAAFRTAAATP